MYCQTSSSVQLEIGNTRMCSPGRWRPLYSDHSSGRWFFGSHWPNSSRMREESLLGTRLLLVSPPSAEDRSETMLSDRVEQGHGLQAVATGPWADLLDHLALIDRSLDRRHDQLQAELLDNAVSEVEHLVEVVARVDVHDRKRNLGRCERLDRQDAT